MLRIIDKLIKKDILLEIRDIRSRQELHPLQKGYLPWSGASVRPTALVYLLNEIVLNNRRCIVECGAGVSTLFIARLFNQLGEGRKLYSIDHDANWLTILKQELKREGLVGQVELIHAPLKPTDNGWDSWSEWYDEKVIEKSIKKAKIDLLFVDGPPANKPGIEMSRYTALPFFLGRMDETCCVILDDADREGERKTARKWSEKLGAEFKEQILNGNIFVGRRGDSYNVM
ncbi:MAG: class I SAM-dependent methyltransferase [Balneolaceae bacterium]